MRRHLLTALAVAATLTATSVLLATGQALADPGPQPDGRQVPTSIICQPRGIQFRDHRTYLIRNDVYAPGVTQCIKTSWGTDGFTVIRSWPSDPVGDVAAYPSIDVGCDIFGTCTKPDPLPRRVSQLTRLRLTFGSVFSGDQAMSANIATDTFFTTGRLDGVDSVRAELMLWLHWRNVSAGTRASLPMCGRIWDLNWWVTTHDGHSWNYLQARQAGGDQPGARSYLNDCDVMPLIHYFTGLGLISPRDDPSSVDVGDECWRQCVGNAILKYQVRVGTRKQR
jgi:hypothetical protein